MALKNGTPISPNDAELGPFAPQLNKLIGKLTVEDVNDIVRAVLLRHDSFQEGSEVPCARPRRYHRGEFRASQGTCRPSTPLMRCLRKRADRISRLCRSSRICSKTSPHTALLRSCSRTPLSLRARVSPIKMPTGSIMPTSRSRMFPTPVRCTPTPSCSSSSSCSDTTASLKTRKRSLRKNLKSAAPSLLIANEFLGFALARGKHDVVYSSFDAIKSAGLPGSIQAYNILIRAAAVKPDIGKIQGYITEMKAAGLKADSQVYASLIYAYGRAGQVDKAPGAC